MSLTCTRCSTHFAQDASRCASCGEARPRRPRLGLVLPDAPTGSAEVAATAETTTPAPPDHRAPAPPAQPQHAAPAAYVPGPRAGHPTVPPVSAPPGPPAPGGYGPAGAPPGYLAGGGAGHDVLPLWPAGAGTEPRWSGVMDAVRRRPGLAVAAAAAALAIGVNADAGGSNVIDGTVTLYDDAFYDIDDDELCTGSDAGFGYSDISSGTPVVARDESGVLVGSTSLGLGHVTGGGCIFTFELAVDGADSYEVEAGDRGSLYYSRDELEDEDWEIGLTLGDD